MQIYFIMSETGIDGNDMFVRTKQRIRIKQKRTEKKGDTCRLVLKRMTKS